MEATTAAQIMDILERYVFNLANLQAMLRLSTPIILAGLATMITGRAGILNIAGEGMINVCTFAAVAGSFFLGNAVGGVVIALVTGALVGAFLALFSLKFNANINVMGIALNISSVSITMFLCRSIFKQAGAFSHPGIRGLPMIDLPAIEHVPIVGPVISGHSIITYIAWLLVPATTVFLYKTPWGWHLRAVGENEDAAASLGINVRRVKTLSMIAAGVFAALAALYLSLSHLQMYTDEMAAGRGFMGMSVNTFGGGEPIGIFLSSLLFGLIETIGWRLQADRIMPVHFINMLPYVFTILCLAVFSIRQEKQRKARQEQVLPSEAETIQPSSAQV